MKSTSIKMTLLTTCVVFTLYASIYWLSGASIAVETVTVSNNGQEYICNKFANSHQQGFEGFTAFCGRNDGILFNNWEPYYFIRESGEEVWL